MTLTRFVTKNAFRNRRRTVLTVISISVSLLLLTLMMTIWRSFYIDAGPPESALRVITRHRVSLIFPMPSSYREKIRAVPGVVNVTPFNWFGGKYKDDKPENMFAQFALDPQEAVKVYGEWRIPPDQMEAWFHDRTGAAIGRKLANQKGFKIGDRVTILGTIYAPFNPELTIRAIIDSPTADASMYFNVNYLEEAVPRAKGRTGMFSIRTDSPESVTRVASRIDDMFRNSPEPPKTETEKGFMLGFISMMGNVKAFILGICSAVVFAILLVSANTMAMSIRERIREVAVLKTLGFTRNGILILFIGEGVAVALIGGVVGILLAKGLIAIIANSPQGGMLQYITVNGATMIVALIVAAIVGFLSAFFPAYRASKLNIAEGLRHLG
jgi:putative ABC transport system permease protein